MKRSMRFRLYHIPLVIEFTDNGERGRVNEDTNTPQKANISRF